MNMKKAVILAIIVILLGVACFYKYENNKVLDYQENINEVAVTIDGEELTLADLAFYVVYEEGQVEEQAIVYNPKNTRDYWNLHIDGIFIQADARNTAMNMAIHDRIFYNLAMEEGMELSAMEEKSVENTIQDFWMDLLDEQQDRIPVSDENINQTIRQIAYAEKYQQKLADENNASASSYDWDGYYYEQMLEEEHTVKINKRIWERIVMGNITLDHDAASYVNGQDEKEE